MKLLFSLVLLSPLFAVSAYASLPVEMCQWMQRQNVILTKHSYRPRGYSRGTMKFETETNGAGTCAGLHSFSIKTSVVDDNASRGETYKTDLNFTEYSLVNNSGYPRPYVVKSTQPLLFNTVGNGKIEITVRDGTISGMGTNGEPFLLIANIKTPIVYTIKLNTLTAFETAPYKAKRLYSKFEIGQLTSQILDFHVSIASPYVTNLNEATDVFFEKVNYNLD